MMRVASHFLTGWLLLGAWAGGIASAAPDLLQETFARMDRAAVGFKGLSSDLRKDSYNAVINDSTIDSGALLLKRPKPHDIRMLFAVKEPDPKTIAVNGRKAQIYYPKANTVEEYDLGKYKSMVDQFLLLGFGNTSAELLSSYSVMLGGPDTVGNQKATRLVLIPKSKEMLKNLTKVELWISDATGMPVQQKFYWPNSGDYMLATYTNMKINPNLPESAVTLIVPKDVTRVYPQK
jgi:outer membrane lipoprotein-sorting protein